MRRLRERAMLSAPGVIRDPCKRPLRRVHKPLSPNPGGFKSNIFTAKTGCASERTFVGAGLALPESLWAATMGRASPAPTYRSRANCAASNSFNANLLRRFLFADQRPAVLV